MCRDMSVPSRFARVPAWPARTTGRTSSLLAPEGASYAWPGTDGHSGWLVRARPVTRTGCAEEAILLVREVRVEHRAGHPRSLDDVGRGNGGVADVGDGCYHGPLQPFPVRCLDSARRQAVPAPGQAWLAFVRAGEASLGPGVGHKPRITGQTLSSEQHQLHCSAGSAR